MSDLESISEMIEEDIESGEEEKMKEEAEDHSVEDEELHQDVHLRKVLDGLESEDDPAEFLRFEAANDNSRGLVSMKHTSPIHESKSVENQEGKGDINTDSANVSQDRNNGQNIVPTNNANAVNSGDVINDVIGEVNMEGTFDNYLMDKLLHSEAEPPQDDLTEPDGYEKPPSAIQEEIIEEEEEIEERFGSSPIPPPISAVATEPIQDPTAHRNTAEIPARGTLESVGLNNVPEDSTLPLNKSTKGVTFEESPQIDAADSQHSDRQLQITLTGTDGATVDVSPNTDKMAEDNIGDSDEPEVDIEGPRTGEDMEDAALLRKINEELGILTDDEESESEVDVPEPELTIPDSSEDEEEDEEEEEESGQMTRREKKAVVKAVRRGHIDLVEVLLEKRNADMNMLWFNENLLMVAIRAKQTKMSEFLIDNGWDYNHSTSFMDATDGYHGPIKFFDISCRQMAFELGLDDIVELIDHKTNNLFPGVRPKQHEIRIRRPRPPTPPTPSEDADDEMSYSGAGDISKEDLERMQEGGEEGQTRRKSERDIDSGVQSFRTTDLEEVATKQEDEHQGDQLEKDRKHCESEDGSSHVFGMDEGYETMSPFSPFMHERLNQSMTSPKEYVSVRGTRASTAVKMHTYRVRGQPITERGRTQQVQYPPVLATGSYAIESKQWHKPAPPPGPPRSNVGSIESIPDMVRTGKPWVHGTYDKARTSTKTKPITSTRAALSPYAQVAKLLAGSRMLDPTVSSVSSSSPKFPSISKQRVYRNTTHPMRTDTNYIYANRSKSVAGDFNMATKYSSTTSTGAADLRHELLPRRKLKSS